MCIRKCIFDVHMQTTTLTGTNESQGKEVSSGTNLQTYAATSQAQVFFNDYYKTIITCIIAWVVHFGFNPAILVDLSTVLFSFL